MNRTYESALKLLRSRRRTGGRPAAQTSSIAKDVATINETLPSAGGASPSGTPGLRGIPSLVGMREWLRMLGHSDSDVNNLNVIHIAGTKGKGSTCAFIRSFLDAHGARTGFPTKIGLYTSPDTRCIRERIQINDRWITEADFTKYFFEVWDRLQFLPGQSHGHGIGLASTTSASAPTFSSTGEGKPSSSSPHMPRYLQLLALIAFHTFIREKTDAAICETHHGGEYDATNLFEHPIATGITTIGLDHIAQLGPTIENIAWHKSGIFRHDTPAFSTPQDPAAEAVIRARAQEKGVRRLRFVDVDPALEKYVHAGSELPAIGAAAAGAAAGAHDDAPARLPPALQTSVQRTNCSLALAIADAFLERKATLVTPPLTTDTGENHNYNYLTREDISLGIANFTWPGRFETIVEGNNQWYLDGAHNELSIVHAVAWFAKCVSQSSSNSPPLPHILIFTHNSSVRDGINLLRCLANALKTNKMLPQYVIFTTYQERQDGTIRLDKSIQPPSVPFSELHPIYTQIWKQDVDPHAVVTTEESIEGALNSARRIAREVELGKSAGEGPGEIAGNEIGKGRGGMQTLVTGSLHLVGGALDFLKPID